MTEYDREYTFPVVFPPEPATGYIAEVLAAHGLTNLRLAETEKYAHVTYFFNGGREEPFTGTRRQLPQEASDRVAILAYQQQPSIGRDRDEHDRPLVPHDLEGGLVTLRQPHAINRDVEDAAVVDAFGRDHCGI